MPLYERGSLARRLAMGTPLTGEEAVEVAMEVLEGLRALHERGVVHGAVKPSNVLVDDEGRLRVADYGLAGIASAGGAQG